MSDVQYSEDGQWWWDNDAQEWKPVEGQAAGGSGQPADPGQQPAGDGGQPGGQAASLSESEANDYFAQSMDAAASDAQEV
jgi:hypothetical protein